MTNSRIAKAVAAVAGLSMALSAAMPAAAVTVADLQAQIALLMAQLNSLQGGSTASVTFTRDLTVGSSGADVTALQQILVSKGYLTMPAGTAFGYFGSLTKAAVARWQAAAGVSPAAGYFGAISRATLSASAGTTTGGTTTGGTTTGGTTTGGVSGVITTPGAEGTIAVTSAPVSNATVFENDRMDSVSAFNVKATGSDVAVQRVKIDLGANTNLYNKVFQTIYVVDDAGRTLASLDMNSTNVVKDGTDYFATLSGFSSVVSKGTQRTYTVKADIRSSVDNSLTSGTVIIPALGVRAVDGAGIDLYGPGSTPITNTFTVSQSLAENATLTVSTDANTPLSQEVVASTGANNNQYDKLPLLTFDIKADKDDVKITDIQNFVITTSGSTGATASTTYLYAGVGTSGQILGSAAVTTGTGDADFNNLSFVIPKGTTQAFTLAADIRSANTSATTFSATLTGNSTNVIGTNTVGDTVTSVSGSATANSVIVRSIGPVFSLNGTPTIARNAGTSGVANGTSTLSASFNVHIKAVGGDIIFGTQAASSTFNVGVYKGGVLTTILAASSTSFSIPSSGVVTSGLATGQAFKLQQNNEVDVPVSFIMDGRLTTGALVSTDNYAVGIESINWSNTGNNTLSSTFMSGKTNWRTAAVALP